MAKSTWSPEFLDLLNSPSKALSIEQYDLCQREWKAAHEKKTLRNYWLAIAFFVAGLIAVLANVPFMAVLLIALAANFNRQSADHVLFAELLESQRLLAMLVNARSQKSDDD
jgi:anti-sigma-K factor RskA